MPRRTLLFLAAIILTIGALVLQFAWNFRHLGYPGYTGKHLHVNLRALTDFILIEHTPALPQVPEWIRKLDGQPVRLRGEAVPANFAVPGKQPFDDPPHDFDLTYTVHLPSKLTKPHAHWFVAARLPAGQRAGLGSGIMDVYGTLRIQEPGASARLFNIDVERIELSGASPPVVLFPIPSGSPSPPPPLRDYRPLITLLTTSSLATAATLLAVWYVLRQRDLSTRAHRVCHNLCLTCGYDLRAAPNRCPECGTPVNTPARN